MIEFLNQVKSRLFFPGTWRQANPHDAAVQLNYLLLRILANSVTFAQNPLRSFLAKCRDTRILHETAFQRNWPAFRTG
jgi:hypothetical protein